jgi:thiamine-monophosphate kinase
VGATLDARQAIQLLGAQGYPVNSQGDFDTERALSFVLAGGDDYELVFTAAPQAAAAVAAAAHTSATPVLKIGRIDAQPGLRLWDGESAPQPLNLTGFDHFK